MRYAVLAGNKVVNIAVATAEFAASQGWVECPEGVGIGWSFDGVGDPVPPPVNLEALASSARAQRNVLLAQSDSQVLPDRWSAMTTEQQTAWAAYRQALRDIPQQDGFPITIVWPTKP